MTCNLRPVEYNVVIKPKAVEAKTAGGIILLDKTVDADKLAADEGEIVAVSDLAFNYDDYPVESRPKVGDVVKFSRYAGTTIRDDKGEIEFRIVKDKDIWAVVEPVREAEVVPIFGSKEYAAKHGLDEVKMPPVNLSGYVDLPPRVCGVPDMDQAGYDALERNGRIECTDAD